MAKELNRLDLKGEKVMRKTTILMSLSCVLLAAGVVRIEGQDQHPILDQAANKVIQKY
jgi:hypothetical protein